MDGRWNGSGAALGQRSGGEQALPQQVEHADGGELPDALAVTGQYVSVPSAIGFIAVFGVAMLNGIVLVSFLNDLRQQGLSIRDAVRQGAALRLRPVLMTASVAILGLVPMLLSQGVGAATLGDPLNALAWLAEASIAVGDPLRAGEVVLSGALGPMAALTAGDYRVEIDGFDPLLLRAVA